jgi:carboxyl-terminal processing protease
VKAAHITLQAFSKGSASALRAAVKQAIDTDKVGAIILDIRGNGGGLLDEGVGVASIFIPQGVIVTTQGLHSPKHSYDATGGAYPQIPLYLLVDQDTASASEIVAGALQDYKRATLIGVTTFGKGLVQSIEPLGNGGAVKVTSAEYFTPKGRNINKKGIVPDIVVPGNPATPNVDAPLQEALKLVGGSTATP